MIKRLGDYALDLAAFHEMHGNWNKAWWWGLLSDICDLLTGRPIEF